MRYLMLSTKTKLFVAGIVDGVSLASTVDIGSIPESWMKRWNAVDITDFVVDTESGIRVKERKLFEMLYGPKLTGAVENILSGGYVHWGRSTVDYVHISDWVWYDAEGNYVQD